MPKKFRLERHRKNEDRKKRDERRVRSPAETLVVSLSLNVYCGSPVDSVEILRNRLNAVGDLPSGKLLL